MKWKWRETFREKMDELTKASDGLGTTIYRTVEDISQTCDIFIDKDRYLPPSMVNWVHWFTTSWTEIRSQYRIDPGPCPHK